MQHHPSEFVELRIRNVAWVFYCCFVCGCINGITTKGIFGLPSTALTAHNVRFAIAAAEDRLDNLLIFFLIVLGYGIGAFSSGDVQVARDFDVIVMSRAGFTLARKSSKDCGYAPIRMDHPNASEWRWQHQLLVSLCLTCLCSAHFLVLRDCSGLHWHLKCREMRSVSTTASIMLTSCSSAMINCIVMHGPSQYITLRASSPTGQIADMFVLLGRLFRSRNRRYVLFSHSAFSWCTDFNRFLWKIKLQAVVASSFCVGAIAGANTFESALSISSLLMPMFMLCPLWLLGIWCLLKHHFTQRQLNEARKREVSLREMNTELPSSARVPRLAFIAHLQNNAADARVAPFPRLSLTQDFPEYESEGVGLEIEPLPRLNVLEDPNGTMDNSAEQSTCNEVSPVSIVRSSIPGEYEKLHHAHFFWIIYVAFVAGAINTIMVHGLFALIGTPTGDAVTLMALRLQYSPAPMVRGRDSFTPLLIFLIVVLAFGLATCFCGFILTVRGASGNFVMLKIDYPAVNTWRPQHQAIVSLCMISLCVSHVIVRDYVGDNPRWIRENDVRSDLLPHARLPPLHLAC